MGSTLSIVNDTADTFLCNVGPDQAAIGIFGIVATVVGALAAIVATAGAAAASVAPAISFVAAANGINTITVSSIAAAATLVSSAANSVGAVATAASVLQLVVDQSTKELQGGGYQEIPPGGSHQFGPFSLSLWQQGHCVRHRSLPNEMRYITDEVFMRPIFSGATDGSNLDHNIQFWIDKFGFENEQTFQLRPPDELGDTWGDVNAELVPPGGPIDVVSPTPPPSEPTGPTGPTAPPEPFICDVCGNGQEVQNLDAQVFIPDLGFVTCGFIDESAKSGAISREQCPLLFQFLGACGCPAYCSLPNINPQQTEEFESRVAALNAQINSLQELIKSVEGKKGRKKSSSKDKQPGAKKGKGQGRRNAKEGRRKTSTRIRGFQM